MKYYTILTLFFFLLSLGAAAPVDKGKGRAIDTPPPSRPNTPPPRPNTPTPEHDRNVPLPGRTDIHTDSRTGVTTFYYGDDNLPEHMGHLQRNQNRFPQNREPMSLAPSRGNRNRADALRNIPTESKHPVPKISRVRDEKMLNMLHNPHHSTSTTVEYLPEYESVKEGGYAGNFKKAIEEGGEKAKGQLRPNPGWLPLHPGQRRGHEAPARLGTQTLRPNSSPGSSKQKSQKAAPAPPKELPHEGYIPAGRDGLRFRPGKKAPPPPPPPPQKVKKPKGGPSNLRPGRVAPAGHVWKPSDGEHSPSHAGAPGHLPAGGRQPPRPQNHEHYMKQLNEKKAAEEKQKHVALPTRPKDPKHAANLAKFEKTVGPGKKGNGSGKANEAPARMQTHRTSNHPAHPAPHRANHPAPHSPPASSNTPPRPPTPPPRAPGSKPRAKKSAKKP